MAKYFKPSKKFPTREHYRNYREAMGIRGKKSSVYKRLRGNKLTRSTRYKQKKFGFKRSSYAKGLKLPLSTTCPKNMLFLSNAFIEYFKISLKMLNDEPFKDMLALVSRIPTYRALDAFATLITCTPFSKYTAVGDAVQEMCRQFLVLFKTAIAHAESELLVPGAHQKMREVEHALREHTKEANVELAEHILHERMQQANEQMEKFGAHMGDKVGKLARARNEVMERAKVEMVDGTQSAAAQSGDMYHKSHHHGHHKGINLKSVSRALNHAEKSVMSGAESVMRTVTQTVASDPESVAMFM
ncbi:putative capsid protein [Lake Sarah-associated circular virus-3]|uniref:putative capsid protein n=1 Tax=Lake Sarah-associated circular virus-3 TaxID=1685757 RepID=UPI000776FF99|nr:putative capsid protein [Lake Sarah-associated circular virus-3]ALE29579.1 putative capsid protein [Lake Sarah-associated circular virus-3]ALE29582.1 putative capsid protein [Lake Sarah-associated circular virus-3]